ncbi:ATP-binding cassette domain-containing protein [Polyangium aurulentum]|uniref:ATP-binding cassette domain-containing protein n=1 Tax=Polyangium aurulentum TaxID=2567896 RepID=UPI0010AED177|nr:ATP-binding cassette domain-containing protein [Polyangium aurulentum]UQA55315.1 ATP-binding cassette domain-containing protein [Polyangium aurulentum]
MASPRPPLPTLLAPARALLRGGAGSLAIVAATALAQRVALPLAALWLGDRGERAAAAALFAAALLSFVRARAAHQLAQTVRLRLVGLYLGPLERGEVVPPPSSDAITARLATALPTLVSWAVEGVAVVVASAVAVPVVAALLAYALGPAALVPLGFAGAVGAAITMGTSSRVEAAWTRSFERSRGLLESMSAAFTGAAELVAHGRAGAEVERLRRGVLAWSSAELSARTASALSSWGALVATLAAALGASALLGEHTRLGGRGDDAYRGFLLVLSAIPTLQMLVAGLANLVYARDELAHVGSGLVGGRTTNRGAPAQDPAAFDPRAEIRVEGVSFAYAKESAPVLRDLSFMLPAGESLAIVGPNGAGKTTLLYLLLGLARPTGGRVHVGGEEPEPSGDRLAFVSQLPYDPPEATIAESLRAFDPGASDARLVQALSDVGLWSALVARAGSEAAALALPRASLSRGQAQRARIARALVREARLIVLDEPEAHLDAESTAELASLLQRLAGERRIIAAIHDRSLAAFAHRTIELRSTS